MTTLVETPPARDHTPHWSFDVAEFPMPSGREEQWRFTPLDRMADLLTDSAAQTRLTWRTDLPAGVTMETVAPGDPLLRNVPAPVDRVGALAWAHAEQPVVVSVAKGAIPDTPVILHLHGPQEGVAWEHLVLVVGAEAAVTVVLEHTGKARYGALVSVLLGDGASLDLVGVQTWDAGTVHVAHHAFRLGRDARVRSTQVSLSGDLVRITETVEYTGPGGEADLAGVFFADAGQHLEHRLFIDHSAPHCRSNVVYKGALQGDGAHTVWIGDVLIRSEAVGTQTYEINRNLVLSDGARADSVPNLEIETGDVVGAGHASATGRFDDEQLFYLQSRGIPPEIARRLVVRGFFAEVLARIPTPGLRSRLAAAVEAELGDAESGDTEHEQLLWAALHDPAADEAAGLNDSGTA